MKSPFEAFWGGAKQAYSQAKAISEKNVRVLIVTTSASRRRVGVKVSKRKDDSLEIHHLVSCFFKNKILGQLIVAAYLLIIHKQFSILQIVTDYFSILGTIYCSLLNKKLIVIITSYRGYVTRPGIIGRLKLKALSNVDAIVTKSQRMYDLFLSRLRDTSRILLIPNGVDSTKFKKIDPGSRNSKRHHLGLAENDLVVLFVGNILKEKGVDILINLFASHKKQLETVKLLLVGNDAIDRQFSECVVQKIFDFDLRNNIRLIGSTRNVEMYYQIADIFILPSKREGLPNVVLEAMSAAIPCIISNLEYSDFLINDSNGFIFDLNHPEEILELLEKLGDDPKLRESVGLNARKFIKEKFDIRHIADKYIEFYNHLMD